MYVKDPRYPVSDKSGEIVVQIFRVYAGDYAEFYDTVTLTHYYKNPNNDAIREWVRGSDPKPPAGRYLFVAPERYPGHYPEQAGPPCATTCDLSYPEFMISRPKSNEPGLRDHEIYFEGDKYFASVKAKSR
jgi:hypothetical protein